MFSRHIQEERTKKGFAKREKDPDPELLKNQKEATMPYMHKKREPKFPV